MAEYPLEPAKKKHFVGELGRDQFLAHLSPQDRAVLQDAVLPVIEQGIRSARSRAAVIAIGSATDPQTVYRDVDMKVITDDPRQSHDLAATISRHVYESPLTVPEALMEGKQPSNMVVTSGEDATQFDIKLPRPSDKPLKEYLAELRRENRSFSVLVPAK